MATPVRSANGACFNVLDYFRAVKLRYRRRERTQRSHGPLSAIVGVFELTPDISIYRVSVQVTLIIDLTTLETIVSVQVTLIIDETTFKVKTRESP